MEVGPAFDSACPLKGDSSRTSRHVLFVPRRDSCIAANRKAAAERAEASADPSRINPTTAIADDCACTASGHAAVAPPGDGCESEFRSEPYHVACGFESPHFPFCDSDVILLTGRFLRCSGIVIGRAFRAEQIRDGARAMRPTRKISPGLATQSSLILASFITLPHFSVSSAMSLPKSAGEPPSAMPS
jgi:hypothetical protein